MQKNLRILAVLCLLTAVFSSCSAVRQGKKLYAEDIPPQVVVRDGVAVTLSDQKLTVFKAGKKVKDYSQTVIKKVSGTSFSLYLTLRL